MGNYFAISGEDSLPIAISSTLKM